MMKKFMYIPFVIICLISHANYGMHDVLCTKASSDDISALLDIINTQAIKEKDKIVILPKKFRTEALKEIIQDKRLFIAKTDSSIVGYKKLYIMNNDDEQRDILYTEIRCAGQDAHLEKSETLSLFNRSLITTHEVLEPYTYHPTDTVLYNGSDFTHINFRNKYINSILTAAALASLKNKTIKEIIKKNSSKIILAFGLVKENAGQGGVDRTPGLAKHFIPFAQSIYQTLYPDTNSPASIAHYQYTAYMPTFDFDSENCIPNPDEQSIPGYGNIFVYPLAGVQREN